MAIPEAPILDPKDYALNELSFHTKAFHEAKNARQLERLQSSVIEIRKAYEDCLGLEISQLKITRTRLDATPREQRRALLLSVDGLLPPEERAALAEEFEINLTSPS